MRLVLIHARQRNGEGAVLAKRAQEETMLAGPVTSPGHSIRRSSATEVHRLGSRQDGQAAMAVVQKQIKSETLSEAKRDESLLDASRARRM